MRPDFSKISYNDIKDSNPVLKHKSDKQQSWIAPEKIKIKPIYTDGDLQDVHHMDYASGIPPFLRGPYSTMYVMRPWTVRQYAGFSTAEESNAFYRRNLAAGLAILATAMTSPTGAQAFFGELAAASLVKVAGMAVAALAFFSAHGSKHQVARSKSRSSVRAIFFEPFPDRPVP